jgi:transposase
MRGSDRQQGAMFSYVSPEARVPQDHPLRRIRQVTNEVLRGLSPEFERLYAEVGRPSVPPEKLLRALLLQVLYSIRSERLLIEQLDYNLLFRWFVGLTMDDPVWSPTTFSKNRDRLLEGEIARLFFEGVVRLAQDSGLMSDEHFTVDGTLIEAWAGQKSFRPKDQPAAPGDDDDPGNPTVNFHGEKRCNATHASTTDPEARLYRKSNGTEAKLCFAGHVLIENRHGLVADAVLTEAHGRSEREAGLEMLNALPERRRRRTVGADKAYDEHAFVEGARELGFTPHVAQKVRYGAVDGRTTRHPGYAVSQRTRKRIEEVFGWLKTVGLMRKTRHRGRRRVGWMFTFAVAAYNIVRLKNLGWGVT